MSVKDQIIRLRYESDEAKRKMEDVNKTFSSQAKIVASVGGGLATLGKTAAVAAAAGIATVTTSMVALNRAMAEGSVLNNLERSFLTLKDGTGAVSVSMAGLRSATLGLLDSTTLLTQANTAMTLGLPGDALEDLYGKTMRLARAQGVDSVRAIESITIGIARQSKLYLDNLGILIDTEKAYKSQAAALKKNVDQLTDAEKRTAFYNATVEALDKKVAQTAETQLSAADALVQMQNAAKDAYAEFGKGAASSDELKEAYQALAEQIKDVDWQAIGKGVADLAAIFTNQFVPAVLWSVEALGNLKQNWAFIVDMNAAGAASIREATEANLKSATSLEDMTAKTDKYKQVVADLRVELEKRQAIVDGGVDLGGSNLPQIIQAQKEIETLNVKISEYETAIGKGTLASLAHSAGLIEIKQKSEEAKTGLAGVKGEVQEVGEVSEEEAKKLAKLNAEFALLGKGDLVKDLADQLKDAAKGLDQVKFDNLLPQFKAAVYDKELAELRNKFKDAIGKGGAEGITEAKLAEMAAKQAEKAGDSFARELSEGIGKAKGELEKITDDLHWDELQRGLEDAIKNTDPAAFNVISQEIEEQFRRTRYAELREQLGQAVTDAQIGDIISREFKPMAEDMAQDLSDSMNSKFEESADFFGDAIYGAITGASFDIEDQLKRMFADVAGGFLAALTQGLGGGMSMGGGMDGIGKSIGKAIFDGISSYFGGGGGASPLGLGSSGGSGIQKALGFGQQAYGVGSGLLGAGGIAGTGYGISAAGIGAVPAAPVVISGTSVAGATGVGTGGLTAALGATSSTGIGAIIAAGVYLGVEGASKVIGASSKGREDYSEKDAQRMGMMLGTGPFAYGAGEMLGVHDSDMDVVMAVLNPMAFAISTLLSKTDFGRSAMYNTSRFLSGVTGIGSKLDPYQKYRGDVVDSMIDKDVLGEKGTFNLFGGGEGRFRASNAKTEEDVTPEDIGLGNLLSTVFTGGIDESLSSMFANALSDADSFNAAVLTTRGLLDKAGISAEEAGQMMIEAYYDGNISLEEMNANLNTLTAVANEDLPSLADGIQLFGDSLDSPRDKIPALGLLFQEMAQEGITSAEDMKKFFAENFSPDVAESLSTIVDSGIDTFDELKNLSLGQTQFIINHLDGIGESMSKTGEGGKKVGEDISEGMDKGTDSIKRQTEEWEKLAKGIAKADSAKRRFNADSVGNGPGAQEVPRGNA